MATHLSALKRHRQSEKRRVRNRTIRSRLRHIVREVRTALSAKNTDAAQKSLAHATRALDKAVTKGVLHRNNAARKIARLTRAVTRMRAGAAG